MCEFSRYMLYAKQQMDRQAVTLPKKFSSKITASVPVCLFVTLKYYVKKCAHCFVLSS